MLRKINPLLSILNFIGSNTGLLAFTLLSLGLMIHHSASIAHHIEGVYGWYFGIVFGIAFDTGVLTSVMRGDVEKVKIYTVVQIGINLMYYFIVRNIPFIEESQLPWDINPDVFIVFTVSFIIPIMVHTYSVYVDQNIFKANLEKRKKEKELKEINNNINTELLNKVNKNIETLQQEINVNKSKYKALGILAEDVFNLLSEVKRRGNIALDFKLGIEDVNTLQNEATAPSYSSEQPSNDT